MKTDGHAAGGTKGLPDPRIVFLTEELAPYLGEDIPPLLEQRPPVLLDDERKFSYDCPFIAQEVVIEASMAPLPKDPDNWWSVTYACDRNSAERPCPFREKCCNIRPRQYPKSRARTLDRLFKWVMQSF